MKIDLYNIERKFKNMLLIEYISVVFLKHFIFGIVVTTRNQLLDV